MTGQEYLAAVAELGRAASDYLNGMEAVYEQFRIHNLPETRAAVRERYGNLLARLREHLSRLEPPPGMEDFHRRLIEAWEHLVRSCEIFCHPFRPEEWILCLRGSRAEMCEAMRLLYSLRLEIPGFARHWVTPEAQADLERLESRPQPPPGVPVGLLYRDWDPEPPRYTLYVPENYTPSQSWPVVVALHGGGGNDHDFVWLYLRQAKSRGYLVLAPKSLGMTWTFSDLPMVLAALEEVAGMYRLDRRAVFLTGVSDGGTFTYEFGLSNPHVFAALAPVAGGFIPWPWHDFSRARKLPLYILHGARDRIIPVEFARYAREVLGGHGYPIVYRELPDWGHAWPFSKMGEIFDFFEDVRRGVYNKGQEA